MKKIFSIIAFLFVALASFAQGGIQGDGRLAPTGAYPIVKFGEAQTGYWPLTRITQRDSIPSWQRTYGMEVYVKDTDSSYQLKSLTLDNSGWFAFKKGSVDLSAYRTKSQNDLLYYPLTGNPSNFLTGINSSQVTTALGYTPVPNSRTINGLDLSANRTLTTDNISEGTTNLYWTTARGDARYPQLGSTYNDPSWITGLNYSKLTGTAPTWNQNTTGNAGSVTNGVYTVGNQSVGGLKNFESGLVFGTATVADEWLRSNNIRSNARKGLFLSDGSTIDWKIYAGGNSTIGNYTEGPNTLVIGTGLLGGGGSTEVVLFHSTGRGNMMAVDAANNSIRFFKNAVFGSGANFIYDNIATLGTSLTAAVEVGSRGMTGSSFLVRTPSISNAQSGLLIDGTYSGGLSTIRLRGIGAYTTGGYASRIDFSTTVNNVESNVVTLNSDRNAYFSNYVSAVNGFFSASNAVYILPITNGWDLQSNNSTFSTLRFRTNDGVLRGGIAANNTGVVAGMVNSTGGWANYADGSGNLYVVGTVYQNYSDERLKKNFRPIDSALNKVMSISGYEFEWNNKNEFNINVPNKDGFDIGVKAQEIANVLPQAVTKAPGDLIAGTQTSKSGKNILTVSYEKIVPLLIEAIKELNSKVDKISNSKQ